MKFFEDNRVSTDQDLDKINEVTRSSRYQKFTKLGFLWQLYNSSWNLHIDGVPLLLKVDLLQVPGQLSYNAMSRCVQGICVCSICSCTATN